MSSLFDSEVYRESQRLPGVAISLSRLMRFGLAIGKPVTLTLEYRGDVDTSEWWTLRWGEIEFVAGKELELCLFRAAVIMRRGDERTMKYAGMSEPQPEEER